VSVTDLLIEILLALMQCFFLALKNTKRYKLCEAAAKRQKAGRILDLEIKKV
jgi:hypothetical protein